MINITLRLLCDTLTKTKSSGTATLIFPMPHDEDFVAHIIPNVYRSDYYDGRIVNYSNYWKGSHSGVSAKNLSLIMNGRHSEAVCEDFKVKLYSSPICDSLSTFFSYTKEVLDFGYHKRDFSTALSKILNAAINEIANSEDENNKTLYSFYKYVLALIGEKDEQVLAWLAIASILREDIISLYSLYIKEHSCSNEAKNATASIADSSTSFSDKGHDSMILGLQYELGIDQEIDFDKAIHYYLIAMRQGNPTAAFKVGWLYYCGVKQPDYNLALHYFRIAAQDSCSIAQFYLGHMYEKGLGVEIDLFEAKKWYEIANGNGNVEAGERLKLLSI